MSLDEACGHLLKAMGCMIEAKKNAEPLKACIIDDDIRTVSEILARSARG